MVGRKELSQLLRDLKSVDIIYVVSTPKNREDALRIGLTAYEREEIIRNLGNAHYRSGPHDDEDMKQIGKVWIFRDYFDGYCLYIKLKDKMVENGKSIIKCLSCHLDKNE